MPRKREIKSEIVTNCGTCVFWYNENPKEDIGHCHRFPPLVTYDNIENEISSTVPRSWREYWCGEFKRKTQ